jgi:adenylate kinase
MSRKVVILMGHPGAGKGTQAKEIMRELNIPQISTGDMLRDAIEQNTVYGVEAKQRMDAGNLVDDETVNRIVAERISREDCGNGFILDGYPRTVPQAETLDRTIRQDDCLFVIEIDAASEDLIDRLVDRLMCPNPRCGAIYNAQSRAPKVAGVCDKCGEKLTRRSDDKEDLIRERFRTYREETRPLIDFYQQRGVFHRVDGLRPISEVTRAILDILEAEEQLARAPKGGKQKFA